MAITNIVLSNEQDTIEVRKALQSLADEISGSGGSTTNNITNAAREVRMILSNNSGAPNTTVDIAAGQVYAQDNESLIVNDATIQATLSSPANNTWYRVFVRGGDGVTAQGEITTSATPTLPTGYTLYRRIGWVRTDGSGNIIGFTQTGDWFEYKVIQTPRTFTASASTARQTIDVIAPPNAKARVIFVFSSGTGNTQGWAMSTSFTDVAATGNAFTMLNPTAGGITSVPHEIVTDSSSLIAWRQAHAWSLAIDTVGWTDLDI